MQLRPLLFLLLCCVCVAPAWSAAPATSSTTAPSLADGRIVLEASQSAGGKLLTAKDGRLIGVVIDQSCIANFKTEADVCIEWKLASPLPGGWWHGVIDGSSQYGSRDFGIQFQTPQRGSAMVGANYTGQKSTRFEFWLYTAQPARSIRIQPSTNIWRWVPTWPVQRLTLEQRQPDSLSAADAVVIEQPIDPTGTTSLPLLPLPPGNWSVTGESANGGIAVVEDTSQRTITLEYQPDRYKRVGPRTAYLYSDIPLAKLTFRTPRLFNSVVLRHNIATTQPSFVSAQPLMTLSDASRIESAELELIGAQAANAVPTFPSFPQGKKIAVLTSWDDGKPEDLRCAEILSRLGYHPSFFLNHDSPAMGFLPKLEALNVEIGSHCYHHPFLYAQPPQRCLDECSEMRRVLEKELGHPVISFAYPNGYFPARDFQGDYILRAVQAAGYWSSRTTATKAETVDTIGDLCSMKTDGFFGNAKDLERQWQTTRNTEGGIFYFWGHSWQIGKTEEQWQKFEQFAAQFAHQPDAWYASQGEFSLWMFARKNLKISVLQSAAGRTVVQLQRPWLRPWLAERCPLTLKLPDGVEKVRWLGKDIPVNDHLIELRWPAADPRTMHVD
jgi:peptidoglycan/xylan/chitin deacetylase (PgdA/CDA1 family)